MNVWINKERIRINKWKKDKWTNERMNDRNVGKSNQHLRNKKSLEEEEKCYHRKRKKIWFHFEFSCIKLA